MGHLGTERTLELAKKRVYWPRMEVDIDDFIHQKCLCLPHKRPNRIGVAPLQSILTNAPMELVSIDFLKLEKGIGGNEYVLLIVDHFTRFAQGYPCRNKSAKTAATKLYEDFVLRFGFPSKILSDQGGEFENRLVQQLNRLADIEKSKTTPYHPQCNGLCERMNETLIGMLRTLSRDDKRRWPNAINKMVHAYNSTQHSVTGYSPFYLMFGREPRLPIDLLLETKYETSTTKSYDEFVSRWKSQMEAAYSVAREKTSESRKKGRERFDEKAMLLQEIKAGDRVLVKNLTKNTGPGTHKLASFWEEEVHVVVKRHHENPSVYYIRKEGSPNSKCRILHRNLLMSIGSWGNEESDRMKGKRKERKEQKNHVRVHELDKKSEEEEEEFGVDLVLTEAKIPNEREREVRINGGSEDELNSHGHIRNEEEEIQEKPSESQNSHKVLEIEMEQEILENQIDKTNDLMEMEVDQKEAVSTERIDEVAAETGVKEPVVEIVPNDVEDRQDEPSELVDFDNLNEIAENDRRVLRNRKKPDRLEYVALGKQQ